MEIKQIESKVKDMAHISGYKPEEYSKCELVDAQRRINALMSWANINEDADLMQACHNVAKEFVWQKGYAQEPNEYILVQEQNIHESVQRVIDKIREEKNE